MPRFLQFDIPPRIDEPEWIDDADQPFEDFRKSMRDVRRANHYLGGVSVVTRQASVWLRKAHEGAQPVTFLDVATGTGDIPEAILDLSKRIGMPVHVIGLDCSPPILRCAREALSPCLPIRLIRGDAFRLPFASLSIDYVVCSLAFHHFSFEQCSAALGEMERVARRGWLVNDVRRAWSAWFLIRIVAALSGVNRLTRHDAPASVLRAYTPGEFRALGQILPASGSIQLRRSLFYRMALVREKG